MSNENAIEPCPCCGGNATAGIHDWEGEEVRCGGCGLNVVRALRHYTTDPRWWNEVADEKQWRLKLRRDVLEAWNRRVEKGAE